MRVDPSFTSVAAPLDPVAQKRARLNNAIEMLESYGDLRAHRRVALAEAYFRRALLPGASLEEAEADLQKAIDHDPYHPKFFFHLGRLLHRRNNGYGAAVEYARALKLAPGNHRVCVHLALALLDLDKNGKELGGALLKALVQGAAPALNEHLGKLDTLLEAYRTGDDGKKSAAKREPAAAAKNKAGKDQGAGKYQKDGEKKAGAQKADAAKTKTPPVPCRWPGLWRVALVDHLSGPKLVAKQVDDLLVAGKNGDGHDRVAEYAVACLFLLLSGEKPKAVGQMAEGAELKEHGDHPAVQLLRGAVALAMVETPAQFVESATKSVNEGALPLELVCLLHHARYGAESEKPLPVGEALRLLANYPAEWQAEGCFRELRLALLDGYARAAWRDEQFEHARLLWREAGAMAPHSVAIAHNLALLTARLKDSDEYPVAWQRAVELRYLLAAGAGDVQVALEERRVLHISFAQQSQQRYCESAKPNQEPKAQELEAWLGDREALDVWLREWDLYYLNSRLRFRSPLHLLGVPRDANKEAVEAARDALLNQLRKLLATQPWAGIKTFCQLAEQAVKEAAERVDDLVARNRDQYYEQEKADADALAREAIDRGFLIHRLISVPRGPSEKLMEKLEEAVKSGKIQKPSKEDERELEALNKQAARFIPVGCALAERLFALPWKLLRPLCTQIDPGVDLVRAFEFNFIALATVDKSEPANEREANARLAALEECRRVLPHSVELTLARVQLLLLAKRHHEAYTLAVETLPTVAADRKDAKTITQNLIVLLNNAAFAEFSQLPEHIREPKSREAAETTITKMRAIVERFPKAYRLRMTLAELMIQMSDSSHIKAAAELIEKGIALALNQEELEELKALLRKAGGQAKVAGVMTEIKQLLEGASERVNKAVEAVQSGGEPALARLREVVVQALKDVQRASQMAAKAGLSDAQEQADAFIAQLKELQKKVS